MICLDILLVPRDLVKTVTTSNILSQGDTRYSHNIRYQLKVLHLYLAKSPINDFKNVPKISQILKIFTESPPSAPTTLPILLDVLRAESKSKVALAAVKAVQALLPLEEGATAEEVGSTLISVFRSVLSLILTTRDQSRTGMSKKVKG